MSFLNAEWRKLTFANYEIDPLVLKDYVPLGTELDDYQGRHFVSLVGFRFVNTKLLGMKIPFHVNFTEVNLRFYVKYHEGGEWKRGVVFIKEIVPKPALTFVANTIYKENYQTMPMSHIWDDSSEHLKVAYQWKYKGKNNVFEVNALKNADFIPVSSFDEFITEHYWGYAKHDKKTVEYEVTHPKWLAYDVQSYKIDVDFGQVYGSEFEFLNAEKPVSVLLAEGSEITVEQQRFLKV